MEQLVYVAGMRQEESGGFEKGTPKADRLECVSRGRTEYITVKTWIAELHVQT